MKRFAELSDTVYRLLMMNGAWAWAETAVSDAVSAVVRAVDKPGNVGDENCEWARTLLTGFFMRGGWGRNGRLAIDEMDG